MQNTKKGQEKCCKWLRGKGKSRNHYKVKCDAQATAGTKKQKQAQGKWQKIQNVYQDKVLRKTAITLQHFCIVI